MLSLLGSVVSGIASIPFLFVGLLVEAVNGWLGLLAVAAEGAVAVLPSFPVLPELPGEWGAAVSYFLPIGTLLGILGGFLTAWALWWGVSAALRWVKVIA